MTIVLVNPQFIRYKFIASYEPNAERTITEAGWMCVCVSQTMDREQMGVERTSVPSVVCLPAPNNMEKS